ncbi:MAG TPA: glycosyltransferase [Polyangiaceae bacterium]|nr:glycosyltransferase [Polyangiaceae bacterium]
MSTAPLLVSVVIANHDYEAYVGEAIDSALGLDWPNVEVIVVDDGSTDGSRAVIERYGARITTIFQANAGQCAACNAGFARSRGDVVIFLDSDDLLDPSLVRELSAVWRPGVSKVQFQMKTVDAQGRPTGSVFPQFRRVPTPEQIRTWVITAGAYPTPPGSGNAYSRAFLERICPLAGEDRASDSYYLAAAPYFGDVVTVAKPLVGYRVHGKNVAAMARLEVKRFAVELVRARWRFEYARTVARAQGIDVPDDVFDKSLAVLTCRIASLRLAPERHPIEGDSRLKVVADVLRAAFVPQGVPAAGRLAIVSWALLVAGSPRLMAERCVRWRFVPTSRPKLFLSLLSALGVLSRSSSHTTTEENGRMKEWRARPWRELARRFEGSR